MSNSVFCIAQSETVADKIVSRLKSEEFADNDISVLFPDKSTTRDFAHEKNTKAPEGAVAGAGAGGIVGGTLGLLAGIGLLAIPGLGPFIAAGPIMASLSGIAAGAALGGVTGALIGMGIPEIVAKRYEGKLKKGNILIAVHADDSKRVTLAKEIFESEGADDITTGSTASVPKAEESDMETTSPDTHNDRKDSNRPKAAQTAAINRGSSTADSRITMTRTGRDPITRQRTPLK
jgi:hypothetical protein